MLERGGRWLSATVWLAAGLAVAADAPKKDEPKKEEPKKEEYPPEGEGWIKLNTQDIPLRELKQVLTPGLFNPEVQHVVAFPPDGKAVDLGLPHEGTGKDGQPRPAIQGALKQNTVWVDVNGDGKPDAKELSLIAPDGETGFFTCQASYNDGTEGPYIFKFQATGEAGKFRLLRGMAKQAEFSLDKDKKDKKHTILLLDDDGNGCFNDIGRDAIFVDDQPANLLGRKILLGGKLFELLVHAGGQMAEIRPLGRVPTGTVNLFRAFTIPQKADNFRLVTVIVAGTDASFSFDFAHRVQELPVGAYDIVFGLLERATETVWIRNGLKTSFNVEANKEAAPVWGGPVTANIQVENDGQTITVSKPVYTGVAGETYVPADPRKTATRVYLSVIHKDKRGRVERTEQLFAKAYVCLPNGELKPATFEYNRNDELVIMVEYKSGILGAVRAEEHLQFIYRRKAR
jgi:hypothetical protein